MPTTEESRLVDEMEPFGDLLLTLRAELDQTTITYEEMLDLNVGRVIQLSRPTGENIAVYAENVLLGLGEVLLIEDTLTVRLSEIWSTRREGDEDAVRRNAAVEGACA